MNTSKLIKGYIFTIISGIIFGCMPLGTKFIYADGVNPMTLVLLRNALAVPMLWALSLTQGKPQKLTAGEWAKISVIGIAGCCLTPALLFTSYNFMDTGTATVLHFVYPTAVILGGMLFMHKKPRFGSILCVLLCTAGIICISNPSQTLNLKGSVIALSSGIVYSVYVLLLPTFKSEKVDGFRFSMYISAISAAALLPICLISGQLALPQSYLGWIYCLIFAFAVCVGAVVLFQQGAFLIGGERSAILSTFEPITGVFVGILVFKERLKIVGIIGTVLIISASILIALFDFLAIRKKEKADISNSKV